MTELVSLLEMVAGAALIGLGLLLLAWRFLPRGLYRRYDILALLVAILALVEARRQRYR